MRLFPLTPNSLSRRAGEGERPVPCLHLIPLSHAVGEGLGVRAKTAGAPHEGFVTLETSIDITVYFLRRRASNPTTPIASAVMLVGSGTVALIQFV